MYKLYTMKFIFIFLFNKFNKINSKIVKFAIYGIQILRLKFEEKKREKGNEISYNHKIIHQYIQYLQYPQHLQRLQHPQHLQHKPLQYL